MNAYGGLILAAVLIVVMLAIQVPAMKRCEARGGAYLWREAACVRGVP